MAFSVQRRGSVMESVPDLHSTLDHLQPRSERAQVRDHSCLAEQEERSERNGCKYIKRKEEKRGPP